jgi:hypothetical protein
MTLSLTTLSIMKLCHYAECQCAECRDLFIGMLNVIMLSVIRLNVVMLSVEARWKCSSLFEMYNKKGFMAFAIFSQDSEKVFFKLVEP